MNDDIRFHRDNLARHDVSESEALEALMDRKGWSQRSIGNTYVHLGKTDAGRIL